MLSLEPIGYLLAYSLTGVISFNVQGPDFLGPCFPYIIKDHTH